MEDTSAYLYTVLGLQSCLYLRRQNELDKAPSRNAKSVKSRLFGKKSSAKLVENPEETDADRELQKAIFVD